MSDDEMKILIDAYEKLKEGRYGKKLFSLDMLEKRYQENMLRGLELKGYLRLRQIALGYFTYDLTQSGIDLVESISL